MIIRQIQDTVLIRNAWSPSSGASVTQQYCHWGIPLLSISPVSSDSRDSPILLIGRSPRDEINQAIEIIVTNFSSSLQSPIITFTKSFFFGRLMINAVDEVLYSLFKGRASIVFCSRGSEMLTEITILSVSPND